MLNPKHNKRHRIIFSDLTVASCLKYFIANNNLYDRTTHLRLEALEDVTTVPALAVIDVPSIVVVKLLRGEKLQALRSRSALACLPVCKV